MENLQVILTEKCTYRVTSHCPEEPTGTERFRENCSVSGAEKTHTIPKVNRINDLA